MRYALVLTCWMLACGGGETPEEIPLSGPTADDAAPPEMTTAPLKAAEDVEADQSLPDGATDDAPDWAADKTAPRPFTHEQLREGFTVGLVYRWQLTEEKGQRLQEWRVIEAEEDTLVMGYQDLDEAGAPAGEERLRDTTWFELQKNSTFNAADTTIRDETIETPAGTFKCNYYEVIKFEATEKYWFSKDHPGPPVRMTVDIDGVQAFDMLLMERRVHTAPE